MRIFALVFLFIFIIILFPITLKVKIDYDALYNKGLLVFYIFGIRIFIKKWKIGINKIIFIAKNNKESSMHIFDCGGEVEYSDYFVRNIIKRIELNTLKLFLTVGIEDFAMWTAISNYFIREFASIGFYLIEKNKRPQKIICSILPDFYRNKLFIALNSSITISLFMIITSSVIAFLKFLKKKGEIENGKRNTY